jgi:hypothetical protein
MRKLLLAILLLLPLNLWAARSFDGTDDKLVRSDATVLITTVPFTAFTMCIWFNASSDTVQGDALARGSSSDDGPNFRIIIQGDVGGDPIRASHKNNGGTQAQATSSTGFTINTWHHACAVFATAASRTIYLDGGGAVTNTTDLSGNQTTPDDRTSIGNLERLSPASYFPGLLMEAAFWEAALTAEEIAILAKGFSPIMVRPGSLVAHVPVYGNDSPENQIMGGMPTPSFTVTGAVKAAHGRIYRE